LIFEIFFQLIAQGKTIVMVTHDRSLSQRVPRWLDIEDGEVYNNGG
jgi:putative ABC transport system ATP-binding protein